MMSRFRALFLIVLLFILLQIGAFAASPVRAQDEGTQVDFDFSASYQFGEYIDIAGTLPKGMEVKESKLYFRASGENTTRSGDVEVDGSRLSYRLDLSAKPLRAFVSVEYWLEVIQANNEIITSSKKSFQYLDNRYPWDQLENGVFRAHWYSGDQAFAKRVLEAARKGLEKIHQLLPLEATEPVDIYVYPSAQEMRATLMSFSRSWVGAHADPDLGVMVISLPIGPEQQLEMERQIPHELMHILLYRKLQNGYPGLPAWLNEGLASTAELDPNPDYALLIERALERRSLLPMASLCSSFPRDASGTFLAYAQSASFTAYLHSTIGATGIEKLLQAYSQGLGCEQAVLNSTGLSLAQQEKQWRRSAFGENAWLTAINELLPWLVLLLAAIILPIMVRLARRNDRKNQPGAERTGEAATGS